MAIQATLLFNEAKAIQQTGSKPVFYRYEATLHANGKDIPVQYVNYIDTYRNYLKSRFDVKTISVMLGEGTYQTLVAPFKANVEMTIRKLPCNEQGVRVNTELPVYTMRYRATPLKGNSGAIEANSMLSDDPVAQDKLNLSTVEFQLIDPVVERMRLFTFGGTFRKTKMEDIIKTVLGVISQNASKDKALGVKGVEVAETVTDVVRNHVMINHSTPFMNLLDWIHEHCGGIFNAGLGWYYQNNFWHVFPPYDTKRFTKAKRTLTVVNLQADRYPNPERSYRLNTGSVILLSTSKVVHEDKTEEALLNTGNGVRFADASTMMSSAVNVEDNKAVFNKAQNASEFIFDKRETGLNMVMESSAKITSNKNFEFSKLAAKNGGLLQCTWENANIDILTPGMPVKVLYLEKDTPRELFGVLIGVDAQEAPVTAGMGDRQFRTNAALTFFVERKRD